MVANEPVVRRRRRSPLSATRIGMHSAQTWLTDEEDALLQKLLEDHQMVKQDYIRWALMRSVRHGDVPPERGP